jgi:hypothetical protein
VLWLGGLAGLKEALGRIGKLAGRRHGGRLTPDPSGTWPGAKVRALDDGLRLVLAL